MLIVATIAIVAKLIAIFFMFFHLLSFLKYIIGL